MNPEYVAPLIYDRARWQAMADQSPTMVWITDEQGEFTGFNRAWLSWRGRTVEQEVGLGWLDALHPEDEVVWTSTFGDHLTRRLGFEVQTRLRRADGTYEWVRHSARPWHEADGTFAGFVGSAHPSHHSKSEDTSDLYRATIEALQEGVVVTDGNGRFLAVNQAASAFLGIPVHHLQGAELTASTGSLRVIDEDGQPVSPSQRPTPVARRTRQPVTGQVLGWHVPDRGLCWFSVHSRPLLDEQGAVNAVVTSFLDVTTQKHAADNARHEARHDALTGLVNRWGLRDIVRQVVDRTPRSGEHIALAYCDLDCFKEVNDSLGHAAGDALLREVAHRIKRSVRSGDVVARIGGDEVVVVLDEVRDLTNAMEVAEKIRASVTRPFDVEGRGLDPHISIGVAMMSGFEAFDDALNRADEAMYAAKAAGRNRVMTLD